MRDRADALSNREAREGRVAAFFGLVAIVEHRPQAMTGAGTRCACATAPSPGFLRQSVLAWQFGHYQSFRAGRGAKGHVGDSLGGGLGSRGAVLSVGALKIGSTTVSYLVAVQLERPLLKTRRVVKLMSRDSNAGRELLRETVWGWLNRPDPPDRLLIGGGQVLRERPQLAAGLPVPVWILSGREEGWLTRLGISAYRNIHQALVVDIGGGSTELVASAASFSLPVGVHRPDARELQWPSVGPVQSAVVVGGMGHVLGLLLGLRPFAAVPSAGIARLADQVVGLTPGDLVARGVPSNRAELVAPGLRLLALTMERYQLTDCSWAPSGLLEGLWLAASLGRGMCWPRKA